MCAGFHQFPVGEHQNAVCVLDRGEAMRYDKGCSPPRNCLHGVLQIALRLAVDAGGRLVQNQYRGIMNEYTSKRYQLALPGGEVAPPLLQLRVQSLRKGSDKRGYLHRFACSNNR